jgi:hypothetical protein
MRVTKSIWRSRFGEVDQAKLAGAICFIRITAALRYTANDKFRLTLS